MSEQCPKCAALRRALTDASAELHEARISLLQSGSVQTEEKRERLRLANIEKVRAQVRLQAHSANDSSVSSKSAYFACFFAALDFDSWIPAPFGRQPDRSDMLRCSTSLGKRLTL